MTIPAIRPAAFGATRLITARTNVGNARPCPKPITKSAGMLGLGMAGVDPRRQTLHYCLDARRRKPDDRPRRSRQEQAHGDG